MQTWFLKTASLEELDTQIAACARQPEVASLLVFAADANGWTDQQLDPLLTQAEVPVLGGIFPQIIHQGQNYTEGAVLVALDQQPEWTLIGELSNPDADFDQQLDVLAAEWEELPLPATHLVFVDGLSTCIATLIESLFMNLGLEQGYLGGGAGSLSFQQQPCLLTPEGLKQDAALLIRLPLASGIGVAHGWEPISEAFKVTQSSKNQVQQLDWQPAFEVYRQKVEADAGVHFTEENFFDLAKGYPLGINKLASEVVVRDPLMLADDQTLVCVGEVPEGSFVRILKGSPDSLISAAGEAARLAQQAWQAEQNQPPQLGCFIDCISRVLFMEDAILEEFQQVTGDYPLVGALTLGEIANTGKDYLEFYNKTAVLGLLGR